jgi:hypothetical protein
LILWFKALFGVFLGVVVLLFGVKRKVKRHLLIFYVFSINEMGVLLLYYRGWWSSKHDVIEDYLFIYLFRCECHELCDEDRFMLLILD